MSRKQCKRKPRPLTNPLLVAMDHATKLTSHELASMQVQIDAAWAALREGRATSNDWCVLAGCMALAKAIESQGVVRGLGEYLDRADAALVAVEVRATTHVQPGQDAAAHWRAPTMYGAEIEAIGTFLELHRFQLEQLSYGEFRRAFLKTKGRIRSSGRRVVEAGE